MEQIYSWQRKFHLLKTTIVNLIASINNSIQVQPPPYFQLLAATRQTNPDYVFASVKFPPLGKYYLNYAAESSSPAILVFINLLNTTEIVMPCIVCTAPSFVPVMRTSSLAGVAALWDATNTHNLHGGVMLTVTKTKNPATICGVSLSRFGATDASNMCTLQLLSERYNFTFVRTMGVSKDKTNRLQGVVGKMDFKIFLNELFLTGIKSQQLLIYDVELAKIDFIIVTQIPKAVNSIWGVFTPFEGAIWWSILASCIGISVILQFQGKGLPSNFSGLRSVQDFIMVQSLLFGQAIADEIIKSVKNKQVARPLLAIWFFVCYILMENLYQGSIYSDLTVLYPPKVPRTFQKLVASNMTIITTSQILKPSETSKLPEPTSILKSSIIPDILKKNFSERFNNFLHQMNSKMEYINGGIEDIYG
ncbi:hypothetical protein Fcan01_17733 [Folsomia candida]|uniref:Uncharacterized protein n=1 Tax=Folsomia candida TaxID=158441 RepID=A0A226DRT5_FOLCA|nr:hypothetical protein Fcan01_17733 [Folsomia candida]